MLDMSSQSRRHPLSERGHDCYGTPAVAVEALLRVERLPHHLWEVAAGRGNIVNVLRAHGHQVVASDLVVVLTAADPIAYQFNHCGDGLDAAVGVCLVDRLDAGVGAVEALHVDAPLLHPGETRVGHVRDDRFRLTDRNEALIGYLFAVIEAEHWGTRLLRLCRLL